MTGLRDTAHQYFQQFGWALMEPDCEGQWTLTPPDSPFDLTSPSLLGLFRQWIETVVANETNEHTASAYWYQLKAKPLLWCEDFIATFSDIQDYAVPWWRIDEGTWHAETMKNDAPRESKPCGVLRRALRRDQVTSIERLSIMGELIHHRAKDQAATLEATLGPIASAPKRNRL